MTLNTIFSLVASKEAIGVCVLLLRQNVRVPYYDYPGIDNGMISL